jgi:hypothetical protein
MSVTLMATIQEPLAFKHDLPSDECPGSTFVTLGCQKAGNTKGGSITVPLTSCFTGLD